MLGFGKRKSVSPGNIAAVVSGQIIPIEKVKDEAFAKKMMGDGVAIVPSDDYIVSPCDGTVSMLYPTLHAFTIHDRTCTWWFYRWISCRVYG